MAAAADLRREVDLAGERWALSQIAGPPRQAAISLWWQSPQAALPTNVGASVGGAEEAAPQTPIAAIATTAAAAVLARAVAATRGKPDPLSNDA